MLQRSEKSTTYGTWNRLQSTYWLGNKTLNSPWWLCAITACVVIMLSFVEDRSKFTRRLITCKATKRAHQKEFDLCQARTSTLELFIRIVMDVHVGPRSPAPTVSCLSSPALVVSSPRSPTIGRGGHLYHWRQQSPTLTYPADIKQTFLCNSVKTLY